VIPKREESMSGMLDEYLDENEPSNLNT
jgi:hypothetical protein